MQPIRVARTCTFSHNTLRVSHVTILQVNKLFFSLWSYTLLLLISLFILFIIYYSAKI
nr:MAG TPA: hypothetical protein [Caudoviricetes sp.]DAV93020.1 MAG TPA: hypothetical protein [Bacteriophage sp.]